MVSINMAAFLSMVLIVGQKVNVLMVMEIAEQEHGVTRMERLILLVRMSVVYVMIITVVA